MNSAASLTDIHNRNLLWVGAMLAAATMIGKQQTRCGTMNLSDAGSSPRDQADGDR